MKTTEEMIAVMQAYADGEKIEYCNIHGVWRGDAHPPWNWAFIDYRIAVTQDSVDWSHVHKDFNFHSSDEEGLSYFYQKEPYKNEKTGMWGVDDGSFVACSLAFSSVVRGTCDWKDSLVERPQ